MKQYKAINVTRIYCALMIIFIHVFEYEEGHVVANIITKCLTPQAVPYFFMVSGFFWRKGSINLSDELMKQYTKRHVVRLASLYAIWQAIYLPNTIMTYYHLYQDSSILKVCMLIFRRLFLAGSNVWWQLLALLEAMAIYYVFRLQKHEKVWVPIIIIGLMLGAVYDMNFQVGLFSYIRKIFYFTFSWSNNVFMKGLPFFLLGCLCFDKKLEDKINYRYSMLMYVGFTAISICLWFVDDRITVPFVPITATLLFITALCKNNTKIPDEICEKMRNMSNFFFLFHCVFIYHVLDPIFTVFFSLPLRYLFTVVACIVSYYVVKKINFKPLNKLMMIK